MPYVVISMRLRLLTAVGLLLLSFAAQAADPLPAWNDTATKQAIVAFVQKVTQPGGNDFVPVEQRIAVFDMDGTLIVEKPLPAAVMPIVAEVKAAVQRHPELKNKPAIAALLAGNIPALEAAGQAGLNDVVSAATQDRTAEDVAADMQHLAETVKNPHYSKPYTQLGYEPMIELLAYLRANGFQTWIASGSPVAFTRAFSQQVFGIPPQQVIGSSLETRFAEKDQRAVLIYTGKIAHIDDKEGKPPAINLAIGTRPIIVGGNVGGQGDIAMMRYSKDRAGPSLQLLINHDDAAREFAYAEKNHYSLDAAQRYGFTVVSIKNDWSNVFTTPPSGDAPSPEQTR
jgi:phosphoglycolate phosphatase-like HAD superfamily hydrolase